jgi:hypothetical protein
MATETAFALAGLGGNNSHGAGFLAAALWRYMADQVTRSWQTIPAPPTFDDFLNLWYPARMLVPRLPAEFFEETAETFNTSHIGVACNSFDPGGGIEYLYVNPVGMTLIKDHHDPDAAYGRRSDNRVIYQAITPAALRNALWLFYITDSTSRRRSMAPTHVQSFSTS